MGNLSKLNKNLESYHITILVHCYTACENLWIARHWRALYFIEAKIYKWGIAGWN